MSYTKEHLLVFLAYISDVEAEAHAAQDIVEGINKDHAQMGIELDFRTWKDVPAEFGNPQQQINREFVEKCDIFIGVIHKKWGTPTGQSNCGFKEEFDIAEGRYNATGRPTILLYAKTVDEQDIVNDEKEGFNKIEEFKNEIIKKQKGFLISFNATDEWKEIIRGRLTQYVVNKYLQSYGGIAEPQSSQAATSVEKYEVMERVKTPKEIQALIDNLAEYKSKIEKIDSIEDFKKIRLFLLSSALFYDTNLYEILGNHEIHLLYLHRENIKTTNLEAKLIFRTIIADRSNLKAGWFWLKNIKDTFLKAYVVEHLINDANKDVRHGTIIFIDKFWQKRYRNRLLNAINDNEDEIKLKVLDICATRGDESYLKTIEAHLSDTNKDVAKSAWTVKFAILSRTKPEDAIKFLQGSESKDRGVYEPYLKKITGNTSETKLRELISDNDSLIQISAYTQLFRNGQLRREEIQSLLNNKSSELRWLAYSSLIDSGEKFDAKAVKEEWPSEHKTLLTGLLSAYSTKQMELIVNKIYNGYPEEALMREINWLPSDTGSLAYFSFGYRFFDSFKDQLYKDLDSGFKRIKDQYIENIRRIIKESLFKDPKLSKVDTSVIASMFEDQIGKHIAEVDKLDKYIMNQFILAALKILILKGTPESLRYARKYAHSNDEDIQQLVVQIIAKHGNAEDVPVLIKIAFGNYGSTSRVEAVRCALKFSSFDKAVIKQFLESGEKEIIKTCLSYDLTDKLHSLTEDAKKLLMDKTDKIRLYALSYLANILTSKKLNALLKTYLAGSTYYYNVVCWLDRILFATPKIRKVYKQELLHIIKNNI